MAWRPVGATQSAQNAGTRHLLGAISTKPLEKSLIIGLVILAASILGIHTRLVFSMASIWPANALLMGILLLRPSANRPLTWLAAGAGFMIADALSGSDLVKSALLNGSNMTTAASGILVARLMGLRQISGTRPGEAMALVIIMVGAAAGSSLAGAFIGPALFGLDWASALLLWFPSEFVNLAIFTPVLMAFGSDEAAKFRLFSHNRRRALEQTAALASLLASVVLMHLVGGPGASSYVVPSLLWCALSFRPFACSLLVMLTCTWILIAAPLGLIPLNIDIHAAPDASSFRLGVSMVSVGIFVVSVINAAWREANASLQHLASHDSLTGLLGRGAFMESLTKRLAGRHGGQTSLLMIDIDHFKAINDTHGHPVGDLVLQEFSSALQGCLRRGSIVGRLGGEEFAVVVEGSLADAGMAVADRIQNTIRALRIDIGQGEPLPITVSIGIAEAQAGTPPGQLLSASDTALYAAKHGGRDRTVALDALPPAEPPTDTRPSARRRDTDTTA